MELFEVPEFMNAQQKIKELVKVATIIESVRRIVKASPKKSIFIFFTLILPLSWCEFVLGTHNVIVMALFIEDLSYKSPPDYSLLYKRLLPMFPILFWVYLAVFLTFYLLSISATTFYVASVHLTKPSSYFSVLTTIRRIMKRVGITFLYALPLLFLHYIAYLVILTLFCIFVSSIHTILKMHHVLVFIIGIVFLTIYVYSVFAVHGHFIACWNFANVVSFLEPNVYGLAAIKRSKQLVQKNEIATSSLAILYLGTVYEIVCIANLVTSGNMNSKVRIFIHSLFVMVLAVVNLLGLTVQNLMYYQDQVIEEGVSDERVLEIMVFAGNDNQSAV